MRRQEFVPLAVRGASRSIRRSRARDRIESQMNGARWVIVTPARPGCVTTNMRGALACLSYSQTVQRLSRERTIETSVIRERAAAVQRPVRLE